jgi:hypothetical protein
MNAIGEATLNAICPYFTMFPLKFPWGILKRHARENQTVCDPFCGRGTTVLAARALGLKTIGIDANPLAVALTEAKLVHTTPSAVVRALSEVLSEKKSARTVPEGPFWNLAFRDEVLEILCRLREGLNGNCQTPERTALRAILLGALHGPKTKAVSRSSYFSNQCPRTYAPKPDYAVRFWRRHRISARRVDVERIVKDRAERYFVGSAPFRNIGHAIHGDSRLAGALKTFRGDLDWIITSPPYYGMRTYATDQWLRLWFLGGPPSPNYSESTCLSHSSPKAFASDLNKVWNNVGRRAAATCNLVIRFGAINDRKIDAIQLLRVSLDGTGWRIKAIHSAGKPSRGRRQADHFGTTSKLLDEFDVWAKRI